MKGFCAVLIGACFLLMTTCTPLFADVINFDDIDASLIVAPGRF